MHNMLAFPLAFKQGKHFGSMNLSQVFKGPPRHEEQLKRLYGHQFCRKDASMCNVSLTLLHTGTINHKITPSSVQHETLVTCDAS